MPRRVFLPAVVGTLFYVVGTGAATRSPLTWIDRDGRTEPIPALRPNLFRTPRLSSDEVGVDSWSPDGRTLAVHHHKVGADSDVLMIPVENGTAADRLPFAAGPAEEPGAVFAPDGRYVAYLSNETGRTEVYISPFPGPGARRPSQPTAPGILRGRATARCSFAAAAITR